MSNTNYFFYFFKFIIYIGWFKSQFDSVVGIIIITWTIKIKYYMSFALKRISSSSYEIYYENLMDFYLIWLSLQDKQPEKKENHQK